MFNFVVNGPDPTDVLLALLLYFLFMLGCLAVITIVIHTLVEDTKNRKPCVTKPKRKHNSPHQ